VKSIFIITNFENVPTVRKSLTNRTIHKTQLSLQDSFRCIKNLGFFGKNYSHQKNNIKNNKATFGANSKLIIWEFRFKFKVIVKHADL